MESSAVHVTSARAHEPFDRIRANLIRCEECNENFFFDFLRHPRYFVTHFKTCHLKNILYRFNGCSEEENQRVRFGPRRKKDATAWFSQLKSTEKRMISMQDNKWGEIAERECWSCRLCKLARKTSEMLHTFEPNEAGRRQALLHLQQFHESAYNALLHMVPAVGNAVTCQATGVASNQGCVLARDEKRGSRGTVDRQRQELSSRGMGQGGSTDMRPSSSTPKQSVEADRSRLRRMKATPEARKAEAERSKRRREQLTPAQRQVDAERRVKRRRRMEERVRSRKRRAEATPDARAREVKRSRERRQNATEQQRHREAQRSRMRRQNATEDQRLRERERCRRRYELQKQQKLLAKQTRATSEGETQASASAPSVSNATTASPRQNDHKTFPGRSRVLPRDLEQRNQLLLQQQAGLGLQIRSLYAALARPPHASP
ncbi:hypothetical protein PsorP6_010460 [Peronosclerospora sorghi]|uniref:Uncharacterized protein n=1 Tax=Peronosclerospora sorghi TaxID=230839 RepID=A0ACC0VWM9_9STRA|nr:hypothetical protein PsorP6_010460 [Peronosclerospora sorghi]